MDVKDAYAKQVRKQLGFFPVWPPGDAVALGDIGVLKGGLFSREGSIADIIGGFDLKVAERSGLASQFRSSDCTRSGLGAKGGGAVQPGVKAEAEMKLSFGSEGGVAFDSAGNTERTIANLLDLRNEIEAARDRWRSDQVLVTRVTDASSFLVVIAGAAGSSVDVTGDAEALGQWSLAHAAISRSADNQGGYQSTGQGPLLLGLYGFNWWKTSIKPLSMTVGPAHDFTELPPRNSNFD